jgi:hypothetical protein
MSTHVAAPPIPDQPYRGIQPFRFIDQQIFAAREEETWDLLSNVTLYRAVLLYGESGTGKSSLINAGLLPRVFEENYIPDRIRVQPFSGREIKVERIRMSGPNEPLAYLASSFAPTNVSDPEEAFELSLTAFCDRLKELVSQRDRSSSSGSFPGPRSTPTPLLIFDQFEEFITLFEEIQRVGSAAEADQARPQAPEIQQAILATLVELIQDETLPVKIIFSFREDYLAKLSLLFDLCPELIDQAQRLRPPRVEVLPGIIRAPFENPVLRAHFLQQSGKDGSELSESLAQQIAADLGRRSEAGLVNLSALQIVCQRLWTSPDAKSLYAASGLDGLLKEYGAGVFRNVSRELSDAAILMLGRMLTGSDTRNIVSEDDLAKTSEQREALSLLINSQIVRREIRRNIHFYEITSEYLVPWIKEKVADHKAAEERHLANLQRLQAEENLQAQQQRNRILKWLLSLMILLLFVVVWLGMYARQNLQRAKIAEGELQKQKEQAEDSREKWKGAFVAIISSEDQKVSQAASVLLEKDQNLAQQIPPRFYIHIAAESQREQAKKLRSALKGKGYVVPAIDNQESNAPPNNELRYFRLEEPGMPAPKDIVAVLNQASGLQWVDKYTGGYENSPNIRPGHFEIWFAALPGSASGWLRAWPVDENNKRINGLTFYIEVTTLNGELVKRQRSGYLPLPHGDYRVVVTAKGYQSVSHQFSIERGKEKFLPFTSPGT